MDKGWMKIIVIFIEFKNEFYFNFEEIVPCVNGKYCENQNEKDNIFSQDENS